MRVPNKKRHAKQSLQKLVVKYMSDRMVVMQDGKIEEMGDADQIYTEAKTPYTQKLISAIPEGKLEDIKRHLESKGIKVN